MRARQSHGQTRQSCEWSGTDEVTAVSDPFFPERYNIQIDFEDEGRMRGGR